MYMVQSSGVVALNLCLSRARHEFTVTVDNRNPCCKVSKNKFKRTLLHSVLIVFGGNVNPSDESSCPPPTPKCSCPTATTRGVCIRIGASRYDGNNQGCRRRLCLFTHMRSSRPPHTTHFQKSKGWPKFRQGFAQRIERVARPPVQLGTPRVNQRKKENLLDNRKQGTGNWRETTKRNHNGTLCERGVQSGNTSHFLYGNVNFHPTPPNVQKMVKLGLLLCVAVKETRFVFQVCAKDGRTSLSDRNLKRGTLSYEDLMIRETYYEKTES
ncbi:hypothetical protein QBC38DRAFT_479782 [Podospora fimiseda]|uniref:Uncharacterized protein n=1 Tax=Podospora fimiseda TaxID=252190 RepID=A0AAN7BNS4_9PEZI|nr:hypothetical protein QBC38DRAFT_479782 [Podospora fimiseda]